MRDKNTFKSFLIHNKRNQIIFLSIGALFIVQFAIFKYFYPFPSFIHGDSFVYIDTAAKNLDINTYMVGYSRFLRLFSVFTSSDTILVAFQYMFMQISVLFLLYTIFYLYRPGKIVQGILLCFMVFNPLFLNLGNLISSDGLFLALSMIWFTLLIWIMNRPSTPVIFWHMVVLFLAFTVRYNALIYPIIAAGVFWSAKLPVRKKILSIAIGISLCSLFVFYTSFKYKQLTGVWQYSPFSGWQMANNAMYAYRYVDSASRKPVPEKFRELDNMIRIYFDSTRNLKKHPEEAIMASTLYMWSSGMPLSKYQDRSFKGDTTASELKRWASMGPFYKDYGLYIIRHYPLEFAKYFLWPNALNYYTPPVEFLQTYNSGKSYVLSNVLPWFEYKSMKVTTRTKDLNIKMLDFFPILSGVVNVIMLFSLLFFALLKPMRVNTQIRAGVLLCGMVWMLNAGFTIFASSAALRFQAFPILLMFVFDVLLVELIWNAAFSPEKFVEESSTLRNESDMYARLNESI